MSELKDAETANLTPSPVSQPKVDYYIDVNPGPEFMDQLAAETGMRIDVHRNCKAPGSCPHPKLRAARAVYEHWMLKECRGKFVVDVGGNGNRHRKLRRNNVHTLGPVMSVADALRHRAVSKTTCLCTLSEFNSGVCTHVDRTVRGSISVHSLYYLKAPEVAKLCLKGEHLALIHEFHGPSGVIGEANWRRTGKGMVTMDAGELEGYEHSDMSWLAGGSTTRGCARSKRLVWTRVARFKLGSVWRFKLVPRKLPRSNTTHYGADKPLAVNNHRVGHRRGELIQLGHCLVYAHHVDMVATRMLQARGAANLEARAVGWLRGEIPAGVDQLTYAATVIRLAQATVPGNVDEICGASGAVAEVQADLDKLFTHAEEKEKQTSLNILLWAVITIGSVVATGPFLGVLLALFALFVANILFPSTISCCSRVVARALGRDPGWQTD